ncbi:hypothetical protein TruAng_007664 [Truncatella angustata]|nr:hypothetical protein TruAng_007664 [Truncatella angustata]
MFASSSRSSFTPRYSFSSATSKSCASSSACAGNSVPGLPSARSADTSSGNGVLDLLSACSADTSACPGNGIPGLLVVLSLSSTSNAFVVIASSRLALRLAARLSLSLPDNGPSARILFSAMVLSSTLCIPLSSPATETSPEVLGAVERAPIQVRIARPRAALRLIVFDDLLYLRDWCVYPYFLAPWTFRERIVMLQLTDASAPGLTRLNT